MSEASISRNPVDLELDNMVDRAFGAGANVILTMHSESPYKIPPDIVKAAEKDVRVQHALVVGVSVALEVLDSERDTK